MAQLNLIFLEDKGKRQNLPVILSMMPPREVQPFFPLFLKYRYIYTGENAFRTELSYFHMLKIPTPPITRNQSNTIGAKSQPTLSVPKCCMLNKPTSITTATNTTTPAHSEETK